MKVALVGCGRAADFHLPNLKKIKDADIVAVCDKDVNKAKRIASTYGISRTYEYPQRMLDELEIDVVHVMTPPATHAKVAIMALDRQCHVLVEKPLTLNLREADEILAAAQRNKRKLCVCHNYLYFPAMLKARQLIDTGKVGDIVQAEVRYRLSNRQVATQPLYRPRPDHWINDFPGGLGIIEEVAPHMIYYLLMCIKQVDDVQVFRWIRNGTTGWNVMMESKYAPGYLSMMSGTEYGEQSLYISGTKAALHVNLNDQTVTLWKERRLPQVPARMLSSLEHHMQGVFECGVNVVKILTGRLKRKYECHRLLIEKFYDSIRHDTEVPVPGAQGREVVNVLEKIYRRLGVVERAA